MTERPILFSGPMVRALLDGRKTQTRRVVKVQTGDLFDVHALRGAVQEWVPAVDPIAGVVGRTSRVIRCPYGVPGDVLWVRERCRAVELDDGLDCVEFHATQDEEDDWGDTIEDSRAASDQWICLRHYGGMPRRGTRRERGGIAGPWVPSIHMPRWASRLTLRITDVRVERLNDCSEADAIAEGLYKSHPTDDDRAWFRDWTEEQTGCEPTPEELADFEDGVWMVPGVPQGWGLTPADRRKDQWAPTPQFAYRQLWDHINGPGAWDANPWVWALTFEVVANG